MFRPQASFSRLLERATSPLQLAQDSAPVTELCALIRRGDTAPGPALAAVIRRAQHNNPHVVLYALQVILMLQLHQRRCFARNSRKSSKGVSESSGQQCRPPAYLLTSVLGHYLQTFGHDDDCTYFLAKTSF